MVVQVLTDHSLVVKLPKCSFGVPSVEYLGHIISAAGLTADPAKLQTMSNWPTPTSVSTLRGFLGLTGYYRRFVRQYATIAAPLTDLLKGPSFLWTPSDEATFQALKTAMLTLPVLRLPDFSLPFDVTTDASQVAVGAVLSQQRQPIAYFSKKISLAMQASSAYEREMYAITEAVQKWRHYLLGRRFHIFTNQKSLKALLN
ncbi:Retrovirus-related Pol polyprotein from transposon [Sesamum alatum]|uniref:Retrovirus-related Pol polyprotein from transposon n=1 Tax=Sesamum alatum TaxID=300844 RepID=A0AAE1XSD6_9LAMI|nr:Retrovirus-related Pol polyprotein from transposon [Sesamum alatum]